MIKYIFILLIICCSTPQSEPIKEYTEEPIATKPTEQEIVQDHLECIHEETDTMKAIIQRKIEVQNNKH